MVFLNEVLVEDVTTLHDMDAVECGIFFLPGIVDVGDDAVVVVAVLHEGVVGYGSCAASSVDDNVDGGALTADVVVVDVL